MGIMDARDGCSQGGNQSRKICACISISTYGSKGVWALEKLVNDLSSAHKTKALRSLLKVQAELIVWGGLFSSPGWAE